MKFVLGNTLKRISSQNARKLVSQWCEGLSGKSARTVKARKCLSNCGTNVSKMWSSTPLEPKPTNLYNLSCSVCGKFFKCSNSLKKHTKIECGREPNFRCHLCRYRTHYPQDFEEHTLRVHRIKMDREKVSP